MTKKEFKNQTGRMTKEQKQLWYKINTFYKRTTNFKDFKTKTAYKNAMAKIYEKTNKEYLKLT